MTWHGYDEVDVYLKPARLVTIDGELVVCPAPNVLGDIIEDEDDGKKNDEYGEDASASGAGLIGGRKFWECVELLEWGAELVELLQYRLFVCHVKGSMSAAAADCKHWSLRWQTRVCLPWTCQ